MICRRRSSRLLLLRFVKFKGHTKASVGIGLNWKSVLSYRKPGDVTQLTIELHLLTRHKHKQTHQHHYTHAPTRRQSRHPNNLQRVVKPTFNSEPYNLPTPERKKPATSYAEANLAAAKQGTSNSDSSNIADGIFSYHGSVCQELIVMMLPGNEVNHKTLNPPI